MIKLRVNNPINCVSPCKTVVYPKKGMFPFRKKIDLARLEASIEQLRQYVIRHSLGIVSANEAKLSDRIIYVRKGTFGVDADLVLINPSVVESYGEVVTKEEFIKHVDIPCNINNTPRLLHDGVESSFVTVSRPYRIVVSYMTENGKEEKIDLEGRDAVIFLQRYHLLDGITPVDIDNHLGEIEGDDYVIKSKDNQNALNVTFRILDMGTGCCSYKLGPIIEKIPGVISCSVSPTLKTVSVRFFSPISYSGELEDVIKREAIYQEIVKGIESFSDEGIKYTIESVKFRASKDDRVGAVLGRRGIPSRRVSVEPTGRERGGCPAHRGRNITFGE